MVRQWRTIERPSGLGELRRAGTLVSRVTYDLFVEQETIRANDEVIEGHRNVYGLVRAVPYDSSLPDIGDAVDLHLADKRTFPCFISDGPTSSGHYRIEARGALE